MPKSALCIVLVLGLIGLIAAPVHGFEAPEITRAAERMRDLGVVTGYEDGSLRLENTISRAELVTIIVRAYGKKDAAELLKGTQTYEDVAPTHWASGYIALAKSMIEENGQSMGVTASTFQPDTTVTAAQSVAFLMKFLGIKPDPTLSWPMDYVQGAVSAEMITEADAFSLDGLLDSPANRGLVFYLADKAFYSYPIANGKSLYQTYVDPEPPTLTVNQTPTETAEAILLLMGKAEGAEAVQVGSSSPIEVDADGSFTADIELKIGPNEIVITAVDLVGNASEQSVKVTRTRPPTGALDHLEIKPAKATVEPGWIVQLEVTGRDANGNPVKVDPEVRIDPPNAGWFDLPTRHFGTQQPGTVTITATAGGKQASTTIEVTPNLPAGANRPPTVAPVQAMTYQAGQPMELPMIATDPEGGPVTCGAISLPAGLSIDPQSCVITGSPTAAGTFSVTVYAFDAGNLIGFTSFQMTIK
ncbi:MAG: putative Ig domain-containing protein [Bacillota bacterium]